MSFLFPRPKTPAERFPEVSVAGAQQGEPLPFLFGTHHMTGLCVYPASAANMIYRKVSTGTMGKGGFGGGMASGSSDYFLNFAICYAGNPVARVLEIKVDDHVVWGSPNPGGGLGAGSANAHGYVTLRQGMTLKGLIRFYFGSDTQAVDSWFVGRGIQLPAWPGWCYAFFEDFEVGTSPTVPKIRIRAEAAPTASPLRDPHPVINTGVYNEANPVHLLADIYTNARYGLGLDPLALDDSWEAAALQVYREGLGVSGYLDRQAKFSAFADDLLDHIGAVFVPRGRQLGLTLIRRTHSVSDAPLIAAAHFGAVELTPSVQAAACTEVMVEWRDATRDYTTAARPLPNIAAALSTGVTRRERLSFDYFTAASAALAAAQGRAPLLVTPPDQLKFQLNRFAGIALEPGDVIRPDYPAVQNGALDGTRVFRLTKVDRPLTGLYLEAEAFEECALVPGAVTTDVVNPPAPTLVEFAAPTPQLALELPWDLAATATLQITHLAARAQQLYDAFRLLGGVAVDQFDLLTDGGRFVQAGTLTAAYHNQTLSVDDTGFVLAPALAADAEAFWPTASVLRGQLFSRDRLGLLHDPATGATEFFAWQTIAPSGANYRLTGLARGLFDTPVGRFPAGSAVYLFPAIPFALDRLSGWGSGVTVNLKAVPFDRLLQADPSLMPTQSLPLVERAKRPFPVSNVRANGVGALLRPTYTAGQTVRLDWIPRTRGAGAGYLNPQGVFDPAIAVEGTFLARIYHGATLLRTLTSAASYTDSRGVVRYYADYTPASDGNPAAFTARIVAVVNGWESLTPQPVEVGRL